MMNNSNIYEKRDESRTQYTVNAFSSEDTEPFPTPINGNSEVYYTPATKLGGHWIHPVRPYVCPLTFRVRPVVSTVQDGFFPYLVQMINSMRGCVAYMTLDLDLYLQGHSALT